MPLSDGRFARCVNDKLVVNLAFKETNYEHDYFDTEYKTQYGKSYTADYQAILARNGLRHDKLKPFVNDQAHPSVLEIGSAAGYFLKIMQTEGYAVTGWEISKTMANYASSRGLKTIRQDFLKGAIAHEKKRLPPYDIVAMFYVLEHLNPQAKIWQHLKRLVRPGGYLVLALPSASGPFFHFNRKQWYATHPSDHAVDYSPKSLRLVGRQFGFSLRHASSEGIHPQRFPLGGVTPFKNMYSALLKRLAISDTIFVILERV